MFEAFGPEKYAPPGKRIAPTIADTFCIEKGAHPNEGPAEVHFGPLSLNWKHWTPEKFGDTNSFAGENLNSMVQRVAKASTNEIDAVIGLLNDVRKLVRKEGEYVISEIARFAKFKRSAQTAMKAISGELKQWDELPN
jgi:hypothetical protein